MPRASKSREVSFDHEVDFLVVGSGAGGLTAALAAAANGLNTLVIEKADVYGGTTALSGGNIWCPTIQLSSAKGSRTAVTTSGRTCELSLVMEFPRTTSTHSSTKVHACSSSSRRPARSCDSNGVRAIRTITRRSRAVAHVDVPSNRFLST